MSEENNLPQKSSSADDMLNDASKSYKEKISDGLEMAREELEKQKATVKSFLENTADDFAEAKELGAEKARDIKIALEELRLQAALAKADTQDALEDQQKKLAAKLHIYKSRINATINDSEELSSLRDKAKQQLDILNTQMGTVSEQVQEMGAELLEEAREELGEKLEDLNEKLEKGKEAAAEKWDDLKDDVSDKLKDLKNRFEK